MGVWYEWVPLQYLESSFYDGRILRFMVGATMLVCNVGRCCGSTVHYVKRTPFATVESSVSLWAPLCWIQCWYMQHCRTRGSLTQFCPAPVPWRSLFSDSNFLRLIVSFTSLKSVLVHAALPPLVLLESNWLSPEMLDDAIPAGFCHATNLIMLRCVPRHYLLAPPSQVAYTLCRMSINIGYMEV